MCRTLGNLRIFKGSYYVWVYVDFKKKNTDNIKKKEFEVLYVYSIKIL